MRVAHREITKKHLRRIAEKVAKNGGAGLGDIVLQSSEFRMEYPLFTVDKDEKLKSNHGNYITFLADSFDSEYIEEKLDKTYECCRIFFGRLEAGKNYYIQTLGTYFYPSILKSYKADGSDEYLYYLNDRGREAFNYLMSILKFKNYDYDIRLRNGSLGEDEGIGAFSLDCFTVPEDYSGETEFLMYNESSTIWKLFNVSEVNKNENE